MTIVTKRKIDELGRLVLPVDYRNHYGISSGDALQIVKAGDSILIKKATEYTDDVKIVDELGRIVIPKNIRTEFKLEAQSTLEFQPENEGIFLKPSSFEMTVDKETKVDNTILAEQGKSDVFERDYSEIRKAYHAMQTANGDDKTFDLICSRGIMHAIDQRFLELPHVINPAKKNAYDKCLLMLDYWAMLKGAKIRGEVDYTHFEAHIEVVSSFFEFFEDQTFEYLRYILSGARNLTFCPTDEGKIRMRVCFDYFEDIGNKSQIIEEELLKHGDIVDALNASADKEKKFILSDPEMYALLSKAAEDVGVTPEEYLDRFEEVWNEDPIAILQLLHNSLQKPAEGIVPRENNNITEDE